MKRASSRTCRCLITRRRPRQMRSGLSRPPSDVQLAEGRVDDLEGEQTPMPGLVRSFVMVSGHLGDGKTVVAANMALASARQGNRVLVIDADFGHQRLSAPSTSMPIRSPHPSSLLRHRVRTRRSEVGSNSSQRTRISAKYRPVLGRQSGRSGCLLPGTTAAAIGLSFRAGQSAWCRCGWFQQGSAFSATRHPCCSGEGHAGHGRRLDAERDQVLGLQVAYV